MSHQRDTHTMPGAHAVLEGRYRDLHSGYRSALVRLYDALDRQHALDSRKVLRYVLRTFLLSLRGKRCDVIKVAL